MNPKKPVEEYEQQIAYILDALGIIDEDFKYSSITDHSTFGDFNLTDIELTKVSRRLGLHLTHETKLVDEDLLEILCMRKSPQKA